MTPEETKNIFQLGIELTQISVIIRYLIIVHLDQWGKNKSYVTSWWFKKREEFEWKERDEKYA